MDLIILANFSQICQSEIGLVELMILSNSSSQISFKLVDLMILTNFGHFHSCIHFSVGSGLKTFMSSKVCTCVVYMFKYTFNE